VIKRGKFHVKLETLETISSKWGIPVSSEQISKLSVFIEHLLAWSRRFNLISKRDSNLEGITKHILDSLTILKFLPIPPNAKIIDIGSGAGFPAIPLKIVRDDLDFSLAESTHKKFLFLKDIVRKLNLSDVVILNGRAENLNQLDSFKNKYDFATAKALTDLAGTVKICFPFLKIGGVLIAYKGEKLEQELKELKQKVRQEAFEVIKKESILIPQINLKRNLVGIEKKLDF
ncbi:MAG: 16S rRNA (guanine(527)-N(7))-methyltransferase RsmG, partial [candidate division Zixibacteria bacterium]|nr:16S rRNA (guanine(527)-N(7))-methyltransferase RsmG [candidate division Zixibacteria bacterium]